MPIPPGPLVNLAHATASNIAERVDLTPAASQQLAPGMSSSDFAKSLATQGLNNDAVGFLANGLENKLGVRWAAESAQLVADKLPPEEVQAMEAAQAWAQGSGEETDLAQALDDTQFNGPGSWAAQAALWTAKAVQFAPPAGIPVPLAPKAIEGAVKLAAALNQGVQLPSPSPAQPPAVKAVPLTQPTEMIKLAVKELMAKAIETPTPSISPQEQAALNDALAPFVDLGLRLAAG